MSKKETRNETLKKQHTIPAPLFPSPSVGAWGHRNRKGQVTTTGVGDEFSFAGNYATWLHIILKKRNLPMVRLEKTFLPEPPTMPQVTIPQPGIATGPGAECFAAS